MRNNPWRSAVALTALLTYLVSGLFLGLAVVQFKSGAPTTAVMDLLVAIFFTLQVVFLFALYWFWRELSIRA